jgi:Domain of unknown function (DUF1707)
VTVGPGSETAGVAADRGRLRASRSDRERVIGMLEAAFVQGQLTKAEFDLRAGRTLVARTYADLAAAAAGRRALRARSRTNAAAWGVCGLIATAFLTVVVIPSGTTMSVVAVTAAVIYAIFWLLTGITMVASRHGRPRLLHHPVG